MDVLSACPLPVASLPWQPHAGAWVITVVSRATFELNPVECTLADEQEPLREGDLHWDGDPAKSLASATDLAPLKPRADVVVVGSAFAPRGVPVRSLVARLVVGDLDKSVEVVGDRFVGPDGSVGEAQPFVKMPLVYERAAGGPGTWNPAGVQPGARDAYGRVVLPNLQPPGVRIGQPVPPVGFGPIAPGWPLRLQRLGRRGLPADLRGQLMPPDIDPGYFNAAPPDQQLSALRGDEMLSLENLHSDLRRLVTRLPGLVPYALIELPGGASRVEMRCDTLWIDTDRSLCSLTYRAQVPVDALDAPGQIRIALDTPKAASEGARTLTVSAEVERALPARALPFATPLAAPPPEKRPAQIEGGLPFLAPAPAPPAPPPPPAAPPPLPPAALPPPAWVPLRVDEPEPPKAAPAAVPADSAPQRARPAPPDQPPDVVELIWFHAASMPRIRRKEAWSDLLRELEEAPIDPELDDPSRSATPAEVENRRDVGQILARAPALGGAGLDEALRGGARRGVFVPKLALFAGELSFPFEEIGVLRAAAETVTPLAGGDEALRAALDAANELLRIPGLLGAPAVAEGLTTRLRDTFHKGKRVVPAGYLDAQVERAVLEHRLYQRRDVFDEKHVRALLQLDPGAPPVPVYLPDHLSRRLPLFARFRARILAEVHAPVDAYETHPAALRALALGRVLTPGPSAPGQPRR